MRKFLPILWGLFLLIIDQSIKGWARKSPFFILNDQFIFGRFHLNQTFVTCIIFLFVLILIWLERNKLVKYRISFSLIAAGALSNQIDRFKWGGVIDYLSIRAINLNLTFNLADILIILGFILYAAQKTQKNNN